MNEDFLIAADFLTQFRFTDIVIKSTRACSCFNEQPQNFYILKKNILFERKFRQRLIPKSLYV